MEFGVGVGMFEKVIENYKRNQKYDELKENYDNIFNHLQIETAERKELEEKNSKLHSENNLLSQKLKRLEYEFKEESFRKQIYPTLEGMKYILQRFDIESGMIEFCLLRNVINEIYKVKIKATNQHGYDKECTLCKEEYEVYFKEIL